MNRKKVTMEQIANVAGVSKFVVSKTLNGKPGVREATRQKVLFIAKQMGYLIENNGHEEHRTPEKREGSGFILVIIPSHEYQQQETNYWSNIVNGVSQEMEAKEHGFMILTEQSNIFDIIQQNNLVGVIGVGHVSSDTLLQLNKLNVPIVMVDHEEPLLKADYIFMDNVHCIYKMTNYLLSIGHERLVFVGDIRFSRSFYDRWLGFRMAMEEKNEAFVPEEHLLNVYHDFKPAFEAWIQNAQTDIGSFPTGFVCANDDIAQQAIQLLAEHRFRIPEDCAVTGFDNLESSVYMTPSLSSVEVLKETLGRRAVDKLYWRMGNPEFPPEKVLISGEIIIRESAGTTKEHIVET